MKTVDQHSTKAEEIQHLKDLAATCKPGSYLADLFTQNFIAYVEDKINSDFTPDLHGELINAYDESIGKDTKHAADRAHMLRDIDKLTEHAYDLESQLEKARQENKTAAELLRNANELYNKTWDQAYEARQEAAAAREEAAAAREELEISKAAYYTITKTLGEEIIKRHKEIEALKAAAYDPEAANH